MRQAAFRAGMLDSPASDALCMALEPEAAALYAKHAQGGGPISMAEAQTFMVVDAGGGTVDITVHEVVNKGGELVLAEMIAGAGGLFGATYVDEAFLEHFKGTVRSSAERCAVWADAAFSHSTAVAATFVHLAIIASAHTRCIYHLPSVSPSYHTIPTVFLVTLSRLLQVPD
jgi:hypothetical protein